MARTLVEARKALTEKRDALQAVFDEAGDDIDFEKVKSISGTTSEKAAIVRKMNDELTELGKEVDSLVDAEEIRRGLKGLKGINDDDQIIVPGTGQKGKKGQQQRVLTLGELFVKSDTFTKYGHKSGPLSVIEFNDDDDGQAQYDAIFSKGMKTLLDTTGFAPETVRLPQILPYLFRPVVFDDLIPEVRTSQNSIEYMEETTSTNAAAAVAEGGTKPESAIAFTEKTSAVRKLATVLPVTDELFADEPAMRGYVENRLRTFMELTRETQILNGNGTPPNLRGILQTSGIQTQAKGADPVPDAIYKGMNLIRVNGLLNPDGVVMHPNDWQDIRLLKTADGIYIWGSPSEAGPERIFGLNVTQSIAMTENTALVGAFRTSAMKFRRSELSFAVSDQHSDFFITNKLMLRVEERLALVVFRPAGFCTVTGI